MTAYLQCAKPVSQCLKPINSFNPITAEWWRWSSDYLEQYFSNFPHLGLALVCRLVDKNHSLIWCRKDGSTSPDWSDLFSTELGLINPWFSWVWPTALPLYTNKDKISKNYITGLAIAQSFTACGKEQGFNQQNKFCL